MMDKKQIQKMIDGSIDIFKQKYLSFRSKIIGDTATDTYQLSNKGQGTGNFLSLSGGTLSDGANLAVGSSSGTKIATGTGQKLGFYGKTPIVQQSNTAGNVTAGATYTATERAMLNDAYSVLRNLGLLS